MTATLFRRGGFVLILLLAMSLISCGDDNDSDPTTPVETAVVRWVFEGDFPVDIFLQIYAQDRDWVWPSADTVFVFPNDDQQHYFDTECSQGERLCYGAWPSDGRGGGWGVGQNNSMTCTNCCTTCADKTVGPITLVE